MNYRVLLSSAVVALTISTHSLGVSADNSALWRNTSNGQNWLYQIDTSNFTPHLINQVPPQWQPYRADTNGDGKLDIIWRNKDTGEIWLYLMNAHLIISQHRVGRAGLDWQIHAIADIDGNGTDDIIWRHQSNGLIWAYRMQGRLIEHSQRVATVSDNLWQIAAAGDADGDGVEDLIWRHSTSGENYLYLMTDGQIKQIKRLNAAPSEWQLVAMADVNGDDVDDLIWRNSDSGINWIYQMKQGSIAASYALNTVANPDWYIADAGDYNADGHDDLLWRHVSSGRNVLYLLQNGTLDQVITLNEVPVNEWQLIHQLGSQNNGRSPMLVLTWHANHDEPQGYQIYYSTTPDMLTPMLLRTITLEDEGTLGDKGFDAQSPSVHLPRSEVNATPGSPQCFAVAAYNQVGTSPLSASSCLAF
jgi:hypothetical protein